MNDKKRGCGALLNPNGSDVRCGQTQKIFGSETVQLCQSCQKDAAIDNLKDTLATMRQSQVSSLQIQPGTVVMLRLGSDMPATDARRMSEELRKVVPFDNLIVVPPNGQGIEALGEAHMRQIGWVKADAVNGLIGLAEISLSMLQAKRSEMGDLPAEPGVNDDTYFEYVGLGAHIKRLEKAISVAKGIQPELPL